MTTPFAVLHFAQSNKLRQRLIVVESRRKIFDLALNFTYLISACCPRLFISAK